MYGFLYNLFLIFYTVLISFLNGKQCCLHKPYGSVKKKCRNQNKSFFIIFYASLRINTNLKSGFTKANTIIFLGSISPTMPTIRNINSMIIYFYVGPWKILWAFPQ